MSRKDFLPEHIVRRWEVGTTPEAPLAPRGGSPKLAKLSDKELANKEVFHSSRQYYHNSRGEMSLADHHAGVAAACRAEQARRGAM